MGTEHLRYKKQSSNEQGSAINPTLFNKIDSRQLYAPQSPITKLQRNLGNQEMQRMINTGVIQAKLKVGQPNDIYEQEADRVAEHIMRMPEPLAQEAAQVFGQTHTPQIQRTCQGCNEEKEEYVQTKTISKAS